MSLKKQLILDWGFLQTVPCKHNSGWFLLLEDWFSSKQHSSWAGSFLMSSFIFTCRLWLVWKAVRPAFRLSPRVLFSVFVTIPHKWARSNKTFCKEILRWAAEAVFGKAKNNMLQCGNLCNVFCFRIIFLAAIFGLRASRSHPGAFDRWEDSHSIWPVTVRSCADVVLTTQSNYEIWWVLVNQAQAHRAKEDVRGQPDTPCEHSFQKICPKEISEVLITLQQHRRTHNLSWLVDILW